MIWLIKKDQKTRQTCMNIWSKLPKMMTSPETSELKDIQQLGTSSIN